MLKEKFAKAKLPVMFWSQQFKDLNGLKCATCPKELKSTKQKMNTILFDMEPTEDWGNKSWTVDCVCGVNFDDEKEMRKSKRGENIEDEVADSLLGMANKSGENVGSSRTTWTGKVPREERAHVQGVVGGESAGTGIFGSALWRASGYVHKKFGFQYKEFDWNDGNETGGNEGGGNEIGSEGSNWGALSLLNNYKAGGVGGSVSFGAGKRTRDEESNKRKGRKARKLMTGVASRIF
ncbi:hypothetical protein AgCh_037371 [Apium graveolens]